MASGYLAKRPRRSLSGRKSATFLKNCSNSWDERELFLLASAFQKYGQDAFKMCLMIETKDESVIRSYIQQKARKESGTSTSQTYKLKYGDAADWKIEKKWERIMLNFMCRSMRRDDYTKIVIPELCQKFVEEAKECTNPQLFNAKAFYQFLHDVFSKENPAELSPKESYLLFILVRIFRQQVAKSASTEEINFIKKLRRPTKFIPMEIKVEEGEEEQQEVSEPEAPGPGEVQIPNELFCLLSRHRKALQSFNPLAVPMWTLASRQEDLCKFFEEQLKVK